MKGAEEMSFFQNGQPRSFEGYSQDEVNRTFAEMNGNGVHTASTMNGMKNFAGFSFPNMGDHGEDEHEYVGEPVRDYTTEVPTPFLLPPRFLSGF